MRYVPRRGIVVVAPSRGRIAAASRIALRRDACNESTSMRIRAHTDATRLLAEAGPFLLRHEVQHSLLMSVVTRLASSPADPTQPAPLLLTVENSGEVVCVAIRTPPHNLALSEIDPSVRDAALDVLSRDLHGRGIVLPGIYAPPVVADRFVALWSALAGVGSRLIMHHLEFESSRVIPLRATPGVLRAATDADVAQLAAWAIAFVDETGLPAADRAMSNADAIARRVAAGDFRLWSLGHRVVTMATVGGTPRVRRIGFVFTPPAERRRGYASALVAALTQRLLDEGSLRVALSTDAANPTSNAIYCAIGYRQVGASKMMAFG